MKKLTSKKGMQKIIIAIVIILSFNFIIPNYSQAGWAGVLAGPIIDFFAGIGDAVLSALQYFMYDGTGGALSTAGTAVGSALTLANPFDTFLVNVGAFDASSYGMEVTEEDEGLTTVVINEDDLDQGWFDLGTYQIPIIKYTPEAIFANEIPALDINFINPTDWEDDAMNSKSITQALHSTIANWYVALRNLAIIALLSVLLYVGIRMVISSTATDKAKYKQMLMDWLVALCIVFFLHYIMSFILTITEIITDGLSESSAIIIRIENSGGEEEVTFKSNLTGLVRMYVQNDTLGVRLIYLLFYFALVIYTGIFTWMYVKRAITMAFLTLMAPLVAITYPIDKMGDGKAQAFNIWLKEFVFNALLQPFHLIIYTIFLGGASQIAASNPIFAILFLAFIRPSETLLRKMFGFDKTNTASGMSSAASLLGGAAVMKGAKGLIGRVGKAGGGSGGKGGVRTKNPVTSSNSISAADAYNGAVIEPTPMGGPGTNPNNDTGTAENSASSLILGGTAGNNTRTAGNNASPLLAGGSTGNEPNAEGGAPPGYRMQNGLFVPNMPNNPAPTPATRTTNTEQQPAIQQNNQSGWERFRSYDGDLIQWTKEKTKFGRALTKGARAIRQIPSLPSKALNKLPDNPITRTIRGAAGTIGKAAVGTAKFAGKAAIGAGFGIAAGIAGDDLEDVFKYGAAGAALGVTGLPVLGRGVASAGNSLRNAYETSAFGEEQAALNQQRREQMSNDIYREAMDKGYEKLYGEKPTFDESIEYAQAGMDYYEQGITSTKEINKSLKFEKELKEQMISAGMEDNEAAERARKQSIVISKLAQETKYDELTNEGKRNDLRDRFVRELKKGGMDDRTASANADTMIRQLMSRKGLSPN